MGKRWLLAVVVILVVGIGVWLFMQPAGDNTATNTPTSNTASDQSSEASQGTSKPDTEKSTAASSSQGSSQSTNDQAPPLTTSQIKNKDTLVLVSIADPIDTLDPGYAYDSGSASIIFNIYETLIFYDGESPDKFIPMLATEVPSVENGLIRDNGLTYEFPIRSGIQFHAGPVLDENGSEIPGSGQVTPEDVVYSIQRMLLQDRAGGPSWMLLEPLLGVSSILELAQRIAGNDQLQSVTAFDADTLQTVCQRVKATMTIDGDSVVFHLTEPFSPFLQVIVGYWASILDKEWVASRITDGAGNVVKKAGWDGQCDSWSKYYDPQMQDSALYDVTNGTGPFILERWRPEEEIYLVRNDDYWRERPAHLKDVSYKMSSEMATRLLMLQQGDADIISIPLSFQDQVAPLVEKGEVTKYENLPTSTLYFWQFSQHVNAENNPYIGSGQLDGQGIPPDFFSDIDVRKGFAYAMDWEVYLNDVINGEGIRSRGPIHSTVFGFNPEQAVYELNLEKAKEHLQKAWGGQLWERGFKMEVPYVSGGQAVKLTTEILAQNLAQINPKFQLIAKDYQSTQISQDGDLGKIPLDYQGWHEDYHDPHNWAFPILHSRGFYARNMGIDPALQEQLDALINQARSELDPEKRKAIYFQLQQIVYDQALIITLEEWTRRRFIRSWLKGYVHNTGYSGYYFWHFYKGS